MIYITGDTHIPHDIHKLSTSKFPEQNNLTKNDYLIVCGDFGGVWDNSNKEKYWLKWLNNKNFTILFVDGNHENFDILNSYPVDIWNGGKVHKISDSIIHLMRGQIFLIDDKKVFTMGGALSHDKMYRKEGKSWWSDEVPNDSEYQEALNNLDKHGWKVDLVITHCTSDSIQNEIAFWYEHDKITNFFEIVRQDLDYKRWYFGHYHIDKNITNKDICLYDRVILV